MKNIIFVIDTVLDLPLMELYPGILDLANRLAFVDMKRAQELRSDTIQRFGTSSQIGLRVVPQKYPDPIRRLLSMFYIHLALSWHESFRITNGIKWVLFKGYVPLYMTISRTNAKEAHEEWAKLYYAAIMKYPDLA